MLTCSDCTKKPRLTQTKYPTQPALDKNGTMIGGSIRVPTSGFSATLSLRFKAGTGSLLHSWKANTMLNKLISRCSCLSKGLSTVARNYHKRNRMQLVQKVGLTINWRRKCIRNFGAQTTAFNRNLKQIQPNPRTLLPEGKNWMLTR